MFILVDLGGPFYHLLFTAFFADKNYNYCQCLLVLMSKLLHSTLISFVRLDVAVDREVEGDLILGDMGYGIPFKPGTFDGVIR